jgi:Ca2+-binding RTX toxin-like protein
MTFPTQSFTSPMEDFADDTASGTFSASITGGATNATVSGTWTFSGTYTLPSSGTVESISLSGNITGTVAFASTQWDLVFTSPDPRFGTPFDGHAEPGTLNYINGEFSLLAEVVFLTGFGGVELFAFSPVPLGFGIDAAGGPVLPSISISAHDANLAEAGDPLSVTLSRSGFSTELSSTVTVMTTPGTALPADFTSQAVLVTFAAGETTKTVSLAVGPTNDTLTEFTESFGIALVNPTSAVLGTSAGSVNILDNDGVLGAGTPGDDLFTGGAENNAWAGGAGNDTVLANGGTDHLRGGNGADSLSGGDGNDSIVGAFGSDTLNGGAGADSLVGGADADRLGGSLGADMLRGGGAADTMGGGQDDDQLYGGGDADQMSGALGNDYLRGALGNDNMGGGQGNDTLGGGQDNDALRGGAGNDDLTGGLGADHFIFSLAGSADADLVHGFLVAEGDVIELSSSFFGALAPGALSAAQFGSVVLYSGGALSYDADGAGAGGALLIATLEGAPLIDQTSIFVI